MDFSEGGRLGQIGWEEFEKWYVQYRDLEMLVRVNKVNPTVGFIALENKRYMIGMFFE